MGNKDNDCSSPDDTSAFHPVLEKALLMFWSFVGAVILGLAICLCIPLSNLMAPSDLARSQMLPYMSEISVPVEITIERQNVTEAYLDDYKVMRLGVEGSGATVYSYDIVTNYPKTGSKYRLTGMASRSLTCIVNKGYPFEYLFNGKEIDAYLTQMAVWRQLSKEGFISLTDPSLTTASKEYSPGVRNSLVKLLSWVEVQRRWSYKDIGESYHPVYAYENAEEPSGTDRIIVCFDTVAEKDGEVE